MYRLCRGWRLLLYSGGVSFGLTFEKLLLIGMVALLIIGPDRLPAFAAQFARVVKSIRQMAKGAEQRLKDEMGDDFNVDEFKKLDPRQYDPRRIIRDALVDEAPAVEPAVTPTLRESAYAQRQRKLAENAPTPFDGEST